MGDRSGRMALAFLGARTGNLPANSSGERSLQHDGRVINRRVINHGASQGATGGLIESEGGTSVGMVPVSMDLVGRHVGCFRGWGLDLVTYGQRRVGARKGRLGPVTNSEQAGPDRAGHQA